MGASSESDSNIWKVDILPNKNNIKINMGGATQESFPGPILLCFIPLAILWIKTKPELKIVALYFCTYYLIWFFVRTYFRYLTPAIPVCLTLRSIGVTVVDTKLRMDPIGIITGEESKYSYLSCNRPTYPCPYYPAVDWINNNLTKDSKTLFLGECRGYFMKYKFVVQTIGDDNPLVKIARKVKTIDEFYNQLYKEERITHFLLNIPEALRLNPYDIFNWDHTNQLILFDGFWKKYVRQVYRSAPDVILKDFRRGSVVPEFWDNYTKDFKNYIYVFEVLPPDRISESTKTQLPPNYLMMEELYTKERREKMLSSLKMKPAAR